MGVGWPVVAEVDVSGAYGHANTMEARLRDGLVRRMMGLPNRPPKRSRMFSRRIGLSSGVSSCAVAMRGAFFRGSSLLALGLSDQVDDRWCGRGLRWATRTHNCPADGLVAKAARGGV